jgi:hypothetical protein
MELNTKELENDNRKIYVEMSKSNIDKYIYNKDFRKAFALFIFVLERLNENEKIELLITIVKMLKNYFIS